ncbi:membrane bound O-acyl transferase family-domain-containing protein, partial [Nemania sp. FL0031]
MTQSIFILSPIIEPSLVIAIMHPFTSFFLSFAIFYFAIQHQRGYIRHLLSLCHVMILLGCLRTEALQSLPLPPRLWVQFVLSAALHTSSTLILEQGHLTLENLSFSRRLKTVVRTWANIRRVPLKGEAGNIQHTHIVSMWKVIHIFFLVITQKIISSLFFYALVSLNIQMSDFGSVKQGLVLPLGAKDVCLRAMLSLRWIWDTYFLLNICHHFLALTFVAILRWDLPQEWPPLFGSVADTYSLLRFWGVFWHRLHTNVFEVLMPQVLMNALQQAREPRRRRSTAWEKSLRALWMFTLSALYHIAVNWVVLGQGNTVHELRFFLS